MKSCPNIISISAGETSKFSGLKLLYINLEGNGKTDDNAIIINTEIVDTLNAKEIVLKVSDFFLKNRVNQKES
mgnify:CR=1 FL=1